ncbi:NTP transferase domain-containing protein [Streptomyces radicis]|uniref:Molybdenum cofactor guanylyltransferase n=1 Tax=Streptomyces radicis TaxID=1750517 RepID=A0A3A9WDE6_9ACTN|nr:NTP transferase domain-containing protein [Streptomyces radicis]RKN11361.1 molybdenum cofactor guanylyltransferase [Streptomyces radicis]RKN26847.1 molybdenum cofactor guanylyltransferase [Streptomyces radicis]
MALYDAVVLAGGGARRLGGADKPAVRVGARTLLDRVLAACRDADRTVVVGPERPTARTVLWASEDPPGGGPLTALHAGLAHTTRPLVAVLAADLPFLGPATVHRLLAVPPRAEGQLLRDGEDRDQPLTAVYRAAPLRRELSALDAEFGTLAGMPLKLLLQGLTLHRLRAPGSLDCDTWADIAAARARIRDHGTVLDEWIAAVKTELGIDPDVDTAALLDTARDAAHGVARPAAPLTTFLIGYAAALHGISPAEAARKVSALAEVWEQEQRHQEQAQAEQRT